MGVLAGTEASVCDKGEGFGSSRDKSKKKEVRNKGEEGREIAAVPQRHPPLPSITVAFDLDLLMETDEGVEV